MYGHLLVPMLQSKILNEWNLIISPHFNDLDCWDVIDFVKVFKREFITGENYFCRNQMLIDLHLCPH